MFQVQTEDHEMGKYSNSIAIYVINSLKKTQSQIISFLNVVLV